MERGHLSRSLEEELEIDSVDYESSGEDNCGSGHYGEFKTTFLGLKANACTWAIYSPKPVTDKRWYYVNPDVALMLDDFIESKKRYYTKLLITEGGCKQYGFVLGDLTAEDGTRYTVPLIFEASFKRTKAKLFVPVSGTVKSFWEVTKTPIDLGNSNGLIETTLSARFGKIKRAVRKKGSTERKDSSPSSQGDSDGTFEQRVFGPKLETHNWIMNDNEEDIWYFVKRNAMEKIRKFVQSRRDHDTNLIVCDGISHCFAYIYAESKNEIVFETILLLRADFEKTDEDTFEPVKHSIARFWQIERVPHYFDTHAADIFYFIDQEYGGVKPVKKKPYFKNFN